MNTLQVGFSRLNITPPMGVGMAGYFRKRKAEGVLDELEVTCLALACEDTKAVMISVDHVGVFRPTLNHIREMIAQEAQIPFEATYIHSTHTHTGPFVEEESENEMERLYYPVFVRKVVDSALLALKDLKPARMGYAVSTAPKVAFIRRYYLKDGSVKTNPGKDDPEVVGPAGEVDERVNVLRFDREGDSIVLANFGNHPDTVGGNLISADWPKLFCNYTEKAIDNVKCIFFNGAQGDVNHVNRFREEWEQAVPYTYENAQRIGRVVSGAVLQVFDRMHYVDVDSIRFVNSMVYAPVNKGRPEDLPEAHRINDLYMAGKKNLLPYAGTMMQTTIIAEARRMIRLENAPDEKELPMTGLAIGPVAFVGIPGEPFTGIGRRLKENEGWAMICPTCLTNGKEGYFPMEDAYAEGGYEARTATFKAGIAELICEEGKRILEELKQKA